ncbi:MAG TPA: exo-alpha-sialidase [Opitutaceae bacterium]|nr:exo-alpha-sialidase [Opitutaceae bacterium]
MNRRPNFLRLFALAALVFGLALSGRADPAKTVEQWGTFELSLRGPSDGNPFVDVTLSAAFTDGTRTIEATGFYDGDGTYRIRFMPDRPGVWHYVTHSNRWPLTGKTGEFEVTPATGGDHGPVRVHDTFHFAYADGTPFFPIGTTIYNWIYQSETLQAETLKSLAASPFNKVRLIILPTNGARRPTIVPYPFAGTPPRHWDFTRFDPAFFRRLETTVTQLRDIGVQADVILFNPYGRTLGLDAMTAADDDRYVRYVVARLAAYRNVWWSLANEYDFIRTMQESDWDRLFQLVEHSDPYAHLRSIHNGARLYDNFKPWVTHVSVQNGSAVAAAGRAEIYRRAYQKPVVYDEVKYEGNIARRWGNLTGQQMVEYFWNGTVAGTYVGHGETLHNSAGTAWVSGGGVLAGEAPARIAFLKQIVASAPHEEIDPLSPGDPAIGGRPGEFYLVYFDRATPSAWRFQLPSGGLSAGESLHVDVIDTWNMTITPVAEPYIVKALDRYSMVDAQGRSVALPGRPYMALRIQPVDSRAATALDVSPASSAVVRSEFLNEHAPYPQCHASTIAEVAPGRLAAAWFGGTRERNPDVGIWFTRQEAGRWTTPVEVATGVQSDGRRYPTWNPVLFQPRQGPLALFYKVGPSPSQWWGMMMTSADGGKTWSAPTRLPSGVLGPIKDKAVELADGTWLAPSSTEGQGGWHVHFERTRDSGHTWSIAGPVGPGPGLEAIQPTILFLPDGRLEALCRTRNGVIAATFSSDQGQTWTPLERTSLPNPNSGIDAVTLADGRQLLVYNNSAPPPERPTKGVRYPLDVALSTDGVNWRHVLTLEDKPLGSGYAYPAVIQSSDGLVHITYTWDRKLIKHVVLDPTKLAQANGETVKR